MGDWSQIQEYNRLVIGSYSPESVGSENEALNINTSTPVAWPVANRAIYVPFLVFQPLTAVKMFTGVGTASGNLDVGIYDSQQNRLVSSGSTAVVGTNAIQIVDIADTLLSPGLFYFALALDNTTATINATAPAVALASAMGVLSQSSAFALPATATFAAAQDAFVPAVGLTTRTTV